MDILRNIVTILFVIDCIILSIVVLLQEGKAAGLGALNGTIDNTYWGKNKGRSMEGNLQKSTKFLAIGFIVLAAILNMNFG
jgi:protein translocase, SecG subunit